MGSSALDLKMAARFWFLSLLVFVGLAVPSTAKFCPREDKDGLECRAQANQFKCGIFFGNLRNDIIWIGAVPDAIPGVRRRGGEQLVREVFPRAMVKLSLQPISHNGKTHVTQRKPTTGAICCSVPKGLSLWISARRPSETLRERTPSETNFVLKPGGSRSRDQSRMLSLRSTAPLAEVDGHQLHRTGPEGWLPTSVCAVMPTINTSNATVAV